jgi:hypothetical protein
MAASSNEGHDRKESFSAADEYVTCFLAFYFSIFIFVSEGSERPNGP